MNEENAKSKTNRIVEDMESLTHDTHNSKGTKVNLKCTLHKFTIMQGEAKDLIKNKYLYLG